MKKLIILLGVAGTSLSAIFVRMADAPAMVLVLYRVAFASMILLIPFLLKLKKEYRDIPPVYYLISAGGGVALALHFTLYFQSLRYTSIASSVALVDTEVLFIGLMTFLFFKERLGRRRWLGILIAIGGSALIAFSDAGSGANVLLGDFIALAGALSLAVYTMICVVCRKKMSTVVYTFVVYSTASVAVLLILSLQGVIITGYGTTNLLSGMGLAVFCTILGHSLFSWGLKYEKAAFVSASKMLEPVFASVMGAFLFGEIPDILVIFGGLLVVAGIVYYILNNRRAKAQAAPAPGAVKL